jgi:REP element-mobilizing transposase RayT
MKKRRFSPGHVHHVYQKPIHDIVLFHTRRDFIVFLTIFFTVKSKYPVRVLSVCPMVDHLHVVLEADSKEILSAFIQEYTSKFVKEYNRSFGRSSGRIFVRRFGCAPRRSEKDARSAVAYSYNNAPERMLCAHAIDYQWNLLAYAESNHPFSEKLVESRCSRSMRKALSIVRSYHRLAEPLGYALLGRLYRDLDQRESRQLTDFILSTYCNVDFEVATKLYGDMQTMLIAIDSNTGKEFELGESWTGYTDTVYAQMGAMLMKKTQVHDVKELLKFPLQDRRKLFQYLKSMHLFLDRQIEKYLQLPVTSGRKKCALQ